MERILTEGVMHATEHRRYPRSAAALLTSLVLGVLVVFGVGGSGAASAGGDQPSDGREAAEVYRSDCSFCHGSDGGGTAQGPTLVGVGAASLDYELSTGRMPLAASGRANELGRPVRPLPRVGPFDPSRTERHDPAYDRRTIDALIEYVTNLTGGGGPPIPEVDGGDVANGGQLFRLQCAACHSWSGVGGALLHREAPPLHHATPVQVGEAIRVGPGQMPDFGRAALDDDEVRDVVAYVRHLDEKRAPGGFSLGRMGPVSEGAVALVGLASLVAFVRWIGKRA